jgi:hypothetical protein
VKAPDQPGKVVDHRREDGEYDSRVLVDVDKAASQLRDPATFAKQPRFSTFQDQFALQRNRTGRMNALLVRAIRAERHIRSSTFCALPTAPAVAVGLPPLPAAPEAEGCDATWNVVPFICVGASPE